MKCNAAQELIVQYIYGELPEQAATSWSSTSRIANTAARSCRRMKRFGIHSPSTQSRNPPPVFSPKAVSGWRML